MSSCRLGSSLKWESAIKGIGFDLDVSLESESGLPALGLDLSLDAAQGGDLIAPVTASALLSLEIPWGKEASLELDVGSAGKSLALAPLASDAAEIVPELSLVYRAAFRSAR